MSYRTLAASARVGAGGCVALLGFAIPISTAFDSILAVLMLTAWLVAAPVYYRDMLRLYLQIRPAFIAALLFAVLLMSSAHADVAWRASWSSLANYIELALIPAFIWAAATPGVRRFALYGYLTAIVLNLLISYGSALHLWTSLPGLRTFPHYPIGFRLSITHSLLVSMAAFVLLLLARELRARSPRLALAALGLAVACIINVLFIVIGRTGYVVLGALLIYFAATITRGRRGALLAVLVIVALFASAYLGSQSFLTRVQDIASDLRTWQRGAHDETSVGVRIGYYLTSLEIIADHPLTGTGVGGFAPAYAEKIRGTAAPATVNPHNDYLMFAVQAGLPAAALVLAFYLFLWRDARKLGSRLERDLMRGFVITFALGGLFNSLLMDHVEGLLLAWATGLLFASHTNTHAANRAPQVRAGSWRRLTDGACDTYARPDWPAFAGADWATRIMHVGVTDDFHEKQGRSTGRWVLQSGSAQLVVYLKRHYRHPRWRGLLAALWPGRGWSAGMLECRHLQWALSQGLCVPKIAAAGEFVGPWGKMQSFLAIEELTGMLPLDQAIPMASRQLEAGAFRIWKAGLALEVARLARFLHDRNLFHRDLYLCHFYVSRADTARVPEWTHKVCMIDFHRLAHHSVARTPWISKDLGQLMFSSDVEGIDTRDRVRFWRAYLGSDRRSLSGGWLRRLVLLRARRYRRHNTKAGARVS